MGLGLLFTYFGGLGTASAIHGPRIYSEDARKQAEVRVWGFGFRVQDL